jgi:hypothetical protein
VITVGGPAGQGKGEGKGAEGWQQLAPAGGAGGARRAVLQRRGRALLGEAASASPSPAPPAHTSPTPGLTGTIPAALGSLTQLQHLALDANRLTGTVPPALCRSGSHLKDLYLRGNGLRGSLRLDGCEALVNLDVQVGGGGGGWGWGWGVG